ncbi:MAG: hypothetical protein S4CHLAM37_00750 [Chlamydiia bacterium]|nr:hypothetical protein [Chlamydiia bacterium]
MLVRIFSLITLVLLVSGCGDFSKTPSQRRFSREGEASDAYFFIIKSDHGSITKNSEGDFELTLDNSQVKEILSFSERPFDKVKRISPQELHEIYQRDDDAYYHGTVGAAVNINGHLQQVYLMMMYVDNDTIVFTLNRDGKTPIVPKIGKTEVYIDIEA